MAAGKIIQPVYPFYLGTFALEVDHGTFVARYGEIKEDTADQFRTGDDVVPGQRLGMVGQLQGLSFSMLHLELYTGTHSGPLTDRANEFALYDKRARVS